MDLDNGWIVLAIVVSTFVIVGAIDSIKKSILTDLERSNRVLLADFLDYWAAVKRRQEAQKRISEYLADDNIPIDLTFLREAGLDRGILESREDFTGEDLNYRIEETLRKAEDAKDALDNDPNYEAYRQAKETEADERMREWKESAAKRRENSGDGSND